MNKEKKKKKKSKIFSYLSTAFDSKQKEDERDEEFNHSSEAESELLSFQQNDEESIIQKKYKNRSSTFVELSHDGNERNDEKAISSKDLPTDERNIFEVKFSNVLLYNAFILLIMLLIRIGFEKKIFLMKKKTKFFKT